MNPDCKKEINYRGLVRFSIPIHWEEEYEDKGGGVFYEAGDETGTLRLNVLSFLSPQDVPSDHPKKTFDRRRDDCNGIVKELSGDRFLLKYIVRAEENGDPLVIYDWEIAKMVSARNCNIAVFNFTISATQFNANVYQDEIAKIECEIMNVQFANRDT